MQKQKDGNYSYDLLLELEVGPVSLILLTKNSNGFKTCIINKEKISDTNMYFTATHILTNIILETILSITYIDILELQMKNKK